MGRTFAESTKISTALHSSPIGKSGQPHRFVSILVYFLHCLTADTIVVCELPFHALGLSGTLPAVLRGVLDALPVYHQL